MAEMMNVGKDKAPASPSRSSPGRRRNESPLSPPSPVKQILHLQRTMGNRAVRRLITSGSIQTKLKIGKPNDKYEQEADRVADKVMRMPEPDVQRQPEEEEPIQTKPLAAQITPLVQRQPEDEELENVAAMDIQRRVDEEELEKEPGLQRKESEPEEDDEPPSLQKKENNGGSPTVTPSIASNIRSLKGGGQPLSASARSFFEPRFGADFSNVRVHTDSKAAKTAKSVNAKAFTTGKDVVFGSGQYSPETSTGKQLMAHELTHVVQQTSDKTIRRLALNTQNINQLRTLLGEDQGDEAINLMSSLSAQEVEAVLSSREFKNLAKKAFNDYQMYCAIIEMNGDLYKSLEWMFDEGTEYEWVCSAIIHAPSGEDKVRSDNWMKNNFVDVCTITEIPVVLNLLGSTLHQKLKWMKAETDSSFISRFVLKANFSLLTDILNEVSAPQRLALYNERFVLDFFKDICSEAQVSNVVDLLGGVLLQKLQLMFAVGTEYEFVRRKVIAASVAERNVVLADQPYLHKMSRNFGVIFGWDDFAMTVELLGRRAPDGNTMLGNPVVSAAMRVAHDECNAFQKAFQMETPHPVPFWWPSREQGGWVYLNLMNGFLTTRRAPPGDTATSISLNNPSFVADSIVVATFHAHPFGRRWMQTPSADDRRTANQYGVPDLVIGATAFPLLANLVQNATVPLRRLHLAGGRGFPGAGGGLAP